jgi:hypothetical protein
MEFVVLLGEVGEELLLEAVGEWSGCQLCDEPE